MKAWCHICDRSTPQDDAPRPFRLVGWHDAQPGVDLAAYATRVEAEAAQNHFWWAHNDEKAHLFDAVTMEGP